MIRLSDTAQLFHEDCREAIKRIPSDSLDSCVTDPPYALVSVVKRFGGANAAPAKGNDAYMRASAGFMGKQWDTGETAFSTEFWAEVYRVLKPGAFVAAFGASRGYHRMACAIEDAGFEIRDSLMYLYGTGFPKSHNLDNKRGDLICGCETESPSECDVRPLLDADVPADFPTQSAGRQILQSGMSQSSAPVGSHAGTADQASGEMEGTGESVLERRSLLPRTQGQLRIDEVCSLPSESAADGSQGRLYNGTPPSHVPPLPFSSDASGMRASSRPQSEEQRADESGTVAGQSLAQDGGAWPNCRRCGKPVVPQGLGSALKPAFEPIVLARKPLSEKTVAANVLRWGTGAINIDGCRVDSKPRKTGTKANGDEATGTGATLRGSSLTRQQEYDLKDLGRWPANICHDGSDEVVGAFPDTRARGNTTAKTVPQDHSDYTVDYSPTLRRESGFAGDSGSAARFFYSAKASKADRNGSKHPTVKPIALMEWLATLITPPGGTILDPFAGSGTTGAAARNKGFGVILCEREAEYVEDIKARFGFIESPPLAPCPIPALAPPPY